VLHKTVCPEPVEGSKGRSLGGYHVNWRIWDEGKILASQTKQNRSESECWPSQSFLLLLPFLILITPFLVFLNHHAYGLFHWEVVIGMMGIAGIAALCSVGMMFGGFVVQNFILFSLIMFFINI
jgi:hypothetical protein